MISKTRVCRPHIAFALLALTMACSNGGQDASQGKKRPPIAFAVEVAEVEARSVEYTVPAVGTVEAFERVQVTARVGGVLERVRFSEGDTVTEGVVLARIDPARFEVAKAAANAQLARAQATVAEAQDALDRRTRANAASAGIVREDEIAQLRARLAVLKADEALAQVSVDSSQIDVRDAYVRAPISGIIETRSAQTGQFVQPGTVLATLVRREPLLLRFKVPDADAAVLKPGMPAHFTVRGAAKALTAQITHVPEAADPATRMVLVTATVTDEARSELIAGAFAEVSVPAGSSLLSPVVPQAAVRPTERGFMAYVVEGDTARERIVRLGLHTRDGFVQIQEGLAPGETLVVRGAEALTDGAKVRLVAAPGTSRTDAEPGAALQAPRGPTP